MIQKELFFSGRVQGVGFRYSACDYARESGLTGWVKNLPDGRVQLLVAGDETAVEEFIQKLNNTFHVSGVQSAKSPALGDFLDFRIIY